MWVYPIHKYILTYRKHLYKIISILKCNYLYNVYSNRRQR